MSNRLCLISKNGKSGIEPKNIDLEIDDRNRFLLSKTGLKKRMIFHNYLIIDCDLAIRYVLHHYLPEADDRYIL